MPIYEYQCGHCDHQFETMQRMSDAPLKECPECGDESLRKLISLVAFRLKGGGWYETDFKKSDARNLVASESSKEDSKAASDKPKDAASKNGDSGAGAKEQSSSTTDGEGKASESSSTSASKSE